MRVNPVPTIPALRTRRKAVADYVRTPDSVAGRQSSLETDLDRRQHASQYAAGSRETDARAFTISLSA